MAEFRIDLKESIRIKKQFTAIIEELKDLEKRLYAVKDNLSSMSEYKEIVNRLDRQCREVTEERKDVEKLLQTFSDCVKCYENAEKKVKEQEIDWHFVLDAAGLIPGIGAAFDGANTAWYAAEGDWSNALLSGMAFAPGIGEVVGGGKTAVKAGGKVIGHLDDVADIAKAADKAEDAAKAAGKAGKAKKRAGELGKYVDEAVESGRGSRIYKDGFDEHLIKGTMGKGSKGVIGGHNFEEFKKALSDAGYNINDCIIKITEHPSIKGVYEIEYRIPARQYGPTGDLEIIPNQYKTIKYPKTVYEPSVVSNEQMIQWGKEAMESGIVNGRNIFGYASNGLRFEGYIDEITGEITNFYPVVE